MLPIQTLPAMFIDLFAAKPGVPPSLLLRTPHAYTCTIRTSNTMNRKLTITVSEAVYEGLHRTIGRRRISQFIEKLARPHVVPQDLEASYRDMAADQAREQEALEWSEGVIAGSSPAHPHAPR